MKIIVKFLRWRPITEAFHKYHTSVVEVSYWGIFLYVFSMYVFPWFSGKGWVYVQSVWDRWQTLNAGVFAFAAAVVGFSIAKYRVEQDRINELSSVRALLPNALSQVSSYCDDLKCFTNDAFYALKFNDVSFNSKVPVFPLDVYDVFSRAIKFSSGDVKERLATMLEVQQVVSARINNLSLTARRESSTKYSKNGKYEFYNKIAELKWLADSLFSFARREMEDVDSSIDIENSYRILGFDLIPDFLAYVKRRTL